MIGRIADTAKFDTQRLEPFRWKRDEHCNEFYRQIHRSLWETVFIGTKAIDYIATTSTHPDSYGLRVRWMLQDDGTYAEPTFASTQVYFKPRIEKDEETSSLYMEVFSFPHEPSLKHDWSFPLIISIDEFMEEMQSNKPMFPE